MLKKCIHGSKVLDMIVRRESRGWPRQLSIAATLAIQGSLALQFTPLETIQFTQVRTAPILCYQSADCVIRIVSASKVAAR